MPKKEGGRFPPLKMGGKSRSTGRVSSSPFQGDRKKDPPDRKERRKENGGGYIQNTNLWIVGVVAQGITLVDLYLIGGKGL